MSKLLRISIVASALVLLALPTCRGQEPPPSPLALAKEGKVDAAIAAWNKWIEREPTQPRHYVALVGYLKEQGRLNDALDTCQAGLRAFPKHYDLLFQMAFICQAKAEKLTRTRGGRGTAVMYLEDVVGYSERAIAMAPNRREPRALRGMALFGLARTDEADAEAKELMRRFPDHPGGFILHGEVLFDRYQVRRNEKKGTAKEISTLAEQIRKAFAKAIELDEARVIPHRRLGDLAGWQVNYTRALTHYADALARDPMRGAPIEWINANTKPEKRATMWADAIRGFHARGTKPLDAVANLHWHAGMLQFSLGKWSETRTHMEKCYALRNDYLNALFWFGLAAFHDGKHDSGLVAFGTYAQKASVQLAKAIRESGSSAQENAGIVSHYADVAFQRGNVPMSRDLNHAIAIIENTTERWNNYAFLCRETGKYESSYGAYRKALEIAPEDPQLLNDGAVILQYHLKRDLGDAKAMYLRAIANAKKRLGKPQDLSDADKKRFRQALADARGNLLKMKQDADKARK